MPFQVRSGHFRSGQVWAGLDRSGKVVRWSGQVRSCQLRSGQVMSSQGRSGHVRSGHITSDHARSDKVRSCHFEASGPALDLGFCSLYIPLEIFIKNYMFKIVGCLNNNYRWHLMVFSLRDPLPYTKSTNLPPRTQEFQGKNDSQDN